MSRLRAFAPLTALFAALTSIALAAGSDPNDSPVNPDQKMGFPVLVTRVEPVYPQSALDKKLEGYVVLRLVIRTDGTVGRAEVVKSTDSIFADPAVAAVKQWVYKPMQRNGQPVAVNFAVRIDFNLERSHPPSPRIPYAPLLPEPPNPKG